MMKRRKLFVWMIGITIVAVAGLALVVFVIPRDSLPTWVSDALPATNGGVNQGRQKGQSGVASKDGNAAGTPQAGNPIAANLLPYRDALLAIQKEGHQRYPENDDLYVKYFREQMLLRVVATDEKTAQAMDMLLQGLAAPNNERSKTSLKLLAEKAADRDIRRDAQKLLDQQNAPPSPSERREKELAECGRILADLAAQGRLPATPHEGNGSQKKEQEKK